MFWPEHFLRALLALMHTLNQVESKIVATSCVVLEKLPKATLHQDFVLSTATLVYSVAVPLQAAMKLQ